MSRTIEARVAYEMLTELETEIIDRYWIENGILEITDDDLVRWASRIYAIKEILRSTIDLI